MIKIQVRYQNFKYPERSYDQVYYTMQHFIFDCPLNEASISFLRNMFAFYDDGFDLSFDIGDDAHCDVSYKPNSSSPF